MCRLIAAGTCLASSFKVQFGGDRAKNFCETSDGFWPKCGAEAAIRGLGVSIGFTLCLQNHEELKRLSQQGNEMFAIHEQR